MVAIISFLLEPSQNAYDISVKMGKLILDRFGIDENASFDVSGVHYLSESSTEIIQKKILQEEKGNDSYII